ncbi:MAG: PAS domain-containing protein, partial [Bythopirellula sp.]
MAEASEPRNDGVLPVDWLAMICLHAAESDNRAADAAVRQVLKTVQTLADSLPLNLLIKDRDGRRVFCNKGYLQLLSVERDDVLSKTDFDLFGDDQARLFSGEDAQVLRTGKEVRAAQEVPSTDGESIWIERVKRPLRDSSGAVVGVQVLFSDATEREQKVQQRELERDLFYSLMDNIPDAIYFKNEESQFLHVSAALARKHRLESIDELIGKTDADVFTGEHAQQARDDELEIMRTGHPLVARLERETWPDREDSWVSSTKMPLRNRRGEIVGTFGISRDVTELKRMQDQLQIARDAADAASRAKSDFLANMSHEIRTPMNGILGMTDLLLNTDLTEEQREYQLLVQTSADSLLALLNDILDFSKVEAGKIELEHLPFKVRDTLGSTLRTLANRAAEKGVELAAHILPDVPDDLLGDASRLRQVVVNLVGNAIKFTHDGEIVVKVTPLQVTAELANLRFAVSDTGIGISAEQKSRIFDVFTQADTSTTREFGGTGLGLSISSQLVHVMGSQLCVESQLGEGSTFHFTVEFERAPTQPIGEAAELSTLHQLPVLVVDDNGTNRVICEEMLENWGMKPTTAASGQRGLELFDQASQCDEPFRLVLVDVMMPEMDGFQFVQHLHERSEGPTTRIIILSSANRPDDGVRSRNLG